MVIAMINTSFYYTGRRYGNTRPQQVAVLTLFISTPPEDALSDTVPFGRKEMPGYLAPVQFEVESLHVLQESP
jgi:hypothetical protein